MSLKEADSDVESLNKEKARVKKAILLLRPKLKRKKSISDTATKENEKSKEVRRKPFLRRKRLQKSKENHDSNESSEKVSSLKFFKYFLVIYSKNKLKNKL